jgi:uncharacterized repeat protein (TIGR02543 family)
VFLLEVSVSPSGGGTVNGNGINPPCNASACGYSFPAGTVVNLTATPAPGYTFVGWGGDCAGAGGCTVTMNAIHSVTATFAPTPPNPNPSGLKVAAACAISPGILPEAVTMLDANNVVIAGRNGSGQPKVAVVNATTCAPDAPVANGNPPVPSGVPAGTPVVGAAVGSDGNIYVGLNGPNKLYIGGWDGTTGQPLTAHGFDQGLVTFSSTGIFAADFVPGAPGSLVFAGASNGTPYVGSFDLETGAFTTDAIIAPAGDSWIPEGLRFDPSGVVDLRGIDVAHSSEFMAVESTSGGAPVSSIPIQYSDTGPPQRIDNVSGQLNVILNNSAGTAGDVTWSPPSTTTTLTQLPTIPGSNTFASGLAPITTSFGPMNAVGFTAEQGSSIATPYVALFNGSTFNAPLQLSAADDQALVNLIV